MLPIIVSAYIDLNKNFDGIKSTQDYLRYSLPLLNLDRPKIIFLQPHIIELITEMHPSTKLIPFSKEELFFKIDGYKLPLNSNPNKDTSEYFCVQLNKTDWIIKASELNNVSSQFIWMDFGISHICPNTNFSFFKKEYENIRIPGCWNPKSNLNISFDSPNWYFCGGIFGGHIDKLKVFDSLVKKYTNKYLESGNITWEVNIWKLIYDDFPELFDWYYSDHDCGMINNY